MYVLVGCECSQVICLAFRNLNIECYSCDLDPCYGGHPEYHIQSDLVNILSGGYFYTSDGSKHFVPHWDILIAHPPCTYLSKVGNSHLYVNNSINIDRYNLSLDAVEFFLYLLNFPIDHICIENPIPYKYIQSIINQKPSQHIEPYYFGDPYYKFTYLWLKNLPLLDMTSFFPIEIQQWVYKKSGSKIRSQTFPGIAAAMAKQWTNYYYKMHAPGVRALEGKNG